MAAAKKKSTKSTRPAAGKKTPARKKKAPARKQTAPQQRTFPTQMVGWGILTVGVGALAALLPIGDSQIALPIRSILHGLGGHLSFALPFVLMWIGLLVACSGSRRFDVGRIFKIAACILIFFGIFQIFGADEIIKKLRLAGWFNFIGQSYAENSGGGAIGALICYPFYYIAGEWGGFALLLFVMMGIFILIYQVSLPQVAQAAQDHLRDGYSDFKEKQSQKSAQRAIEREERRRAAEQRRQEEAWAYPWEEEEAPALDETIEEYFGEDAYAENAVMEPLDPNAFEAPQYTHAKGRKTQAAFGDPQPTSPKKRASKKPPVKTSSGAGKQSMHGERRKPAAAKPVPTETPAAEKKAAKPSKPSVQTAADTPVFDVPVTAGTDRQIPAFDGGTVDTPTDTAVPFVSDPFAEEPAVCKEAPIAIADEEPVHEIEYADPVDPLPFPAFEDEQPIQRERRRKDLNKPLNPSEPTGSEESQTPQRRKEQPVIIEGEYNYPPVDLLALPTLTREADRDIRDQKKAEKLESTLHDFGINAKMTGIAHGPAVTRFELAPAPGVKVSRITSLSDDIALSLAALSVRIEAPIPGKAAVGVEIPNEVIETVALREVLESAEARKHPSRLAVCMGKDNSGHYIVGDIAKMPHVLIAGATGSGKSVCINCIICSILYRATPDEVRLIMIDPKVVELSIYNGIPHLLVPVVTDPKKAAGALQWAVAEMSERYNKFAERGVRDMKGYNATCTEGEKPLPQIVIIIDELADLMMVAPGEVEDAICRLAQLARAAGIHLVIATQRPSVNVITGVIKANIPARIAFTVSSYVDSRTILDVGGAEKLLGRGDMLFAPAGSNKMQRVQGAWVSDEEVHSIVDYIKQRHDADYNESVIEHMNKSGEAADDDSEEPSPEDCDPMLQQAVEIVVEAGQASISMLQRRMRIGYARAGRLIDEMAARGIVSQSEGAKPRNVLITREQFNAMFHTESA